MELLRPFVVMQKKLNENRPGKQFRDSGMCDDVKNMRNKSKMDEKFQFTEKTNDTKRQRKKIKLNTITKDEQLTPKKKKKLKDTKPKQYIIRLDQKPQKKRENIR